MCLGSSAASEVVSEDQEAVEDVRSEGRELFLPNNPKDVWGIVGKKDNGSVISDHKNYVSMLSGYYDTFFNNKVSYGGKVMASEDFCLS